MSNTKRFISLPATSQSRSGSASLRNTGQASWTVTLLFVICLFCVPATSLAQVQLGNDINGEAMNEWLGISTSLSSDGQRLATSSLYAEMRAGQVRVYEWTGTDWGELGRITGETPDDQSGYSISLSSDGNRLAIGAFMNDGVNGVDSGHVRIFEWSGAAWLQVGEDIDGEAANDRSGFAVSLSADGNRVAIGAEWNDGANGGDSGHARVYEWSGTAWVQMGLDIDGEAAGDWLQSISLSADGNRLAIGAIYNSGAAYQAGHVRVYQWSGTAWTQLGVDIAGEAARDSVGMSVSLSATGNRLAVASGGSDGEVYGNVRVYEWNGVSDWVQVGNDIEGEQESDLFGNSLSLSADGQRLAIGAYRNDGANGVDSGHVRVYQWLNSTWTQLGIDMDGAAAGDEFGRSVSLSANGNRLAISALRNGSSWEGAGQVQVYDLSMFSQFEINPGLNDAWYYLPTDGQGFFITVFPDLGKVNLAWFTYDTEHPPPGATANLGDPGHRWLTALGRYTGNQATMRITFASGGLFDTPVTVAPVTRIKDGTIILTFDSCNSGTAEYDIPSLGISGIVPIQRVVDDNVALCEAFLAQ